MSKSLNELSEHACLLGIKLDFSEAKGPFVIIFFTFSFVFQSLNLERAETEDNCCQYTGPVEQFQIQWRIGLFGGHNLPPLIRRGICILV